MNKTFWIAVIAAALLCGCAGGEGDRGDVAAAEAAAAKAPKSAAELTAEMPPEARRQAESAIQQQQAMKAQGDAQAEAMRKMRQQQGG